MSRLIAIDPASHKCGIAYFEDGHLITAWTIESKEKTPLKRRLDVAQWIQAALTTYKAQEVVSEEPFLQGFNANGMQRLLGCIEWATDGAVYFIHPSTVKKAMGSGGLDKLEVALSAGSKLKSALEQEMLAEIVKREAWDESDAIAIGLTYLEGRK